MEWYNSLMLSTLIFVFILSFAFGLIYRSVMKKVAKGTARGVGKNIDTKDRMVRVVCGLLLLFLAWYLSWNPVILFFAGFCFFEAIFSWCGFYALIGRSTCPIE